MGPHIPWQRQEEQNDAPWSVKSQRFCGGIFTVYMYIRSLQWTLQISYNFVHYTLINLKKIKSNYIICVTPVLGIPSRRGRVSSSTYMGGLPTHPVVQHPLGCLQHLQPRESKCLTCIKTLFSLPTPLQCMCTVLSLFSDEETNPAN